MEKHARCMPCVRASQLTRPDVVDTGFCGIAMQTRGPVAVWMLKLYNTQSSAPLTVRSMEAKARFPGS